MELAPMRYKNFVWPHNPRTYTIEYRREMGVHKVPFGRYHLQDLGPTRRVMRGEGEFVGEEAYRQFKELASVFYSDGPGVLVHPVWQTASAYFVELSLTQEPRKDHVGYAFAFWEDYDGYQACARKTEERSVEGGGAPATEGGETGPVWHTVARGETLWKVARDYGIDLKTVMEWNPQIKNPNLIFPGEKVRVR